jgi:hypothetical protein
MFRGILGAQRSSVVVLLCLPDQISHTTPRLREELIEARIFESTNDSSFRGRSAPVKDQIWTAAAAHVLRKHRPHYMAFHLLITDSKRH